MRCEAWAKEPSPASAGVTLLELTIAAAIITILASVAVPRFLVLHDGFRVRAAAERIAVELRKTQVRARAEGRPFRILDATTTEGDRVVLALEIYTVEESGQETRLRIVVLEDRQLVVESFGPFHVTGRGEFLNDRGFVRSPIRFGIADAFRTVLVQRSGRILVR